MRCIRGRSFAAALSVSQDVLLSHFLPLDGEIFIKPGLKVAENRGWRIRETIYFERRIKNMEMLWEEKKDEKQYSVQRVTISKTFGASRDDILCYERKYSSLDEEQLMQLIRDAKANNWTMLDLSNCALKQLPDELWELHSLKALYLGNRAGRKGNVNTYNEIPSKIGELKNLEALSISYLPNVQIPKSIKQLPNLAYLDCFGCSYKKIPNNLLNRNIMAIGIECFTADELLKLCKIKGLKEIFLAGSQLKSLPIEIGELKSLRALSLVRSRVEQIPESMLNLKNLMYFGIEGTPLANTIPEEIMSQTPFEVISFICRQQKQQETFFFNESKMIIVGQGNVGKSCLLERIMNDNYEEKESTEGIDVKTWVYTNKKKKYTLNIWDFGGQEIYHSTHQFFLTKRSLYIFVWDARAEEEYGRIDYWLKTIESFAGDSPIIICINKCDKNTSRINRIDLNEYKKKYPQIQSVLDISCKDNINIKRLRTIIINQASNLQITKEKWLKSWYDIRGEIENYSKTRKFISYDEYKEICKKFNVETEEGKSLSKYLHDLGIILHYQDDMYLKSIVILSPEWATSAVYRILDSQENILKNRNGVLYLSDLPLIWNDSEIYPEDKYVFLLKIMEKFELCYAIDGESYLVAELLENTSLECPNEWNFNNTSCLKIVYQYDFMPAGIMTRFIVNVSEYIAMINGKSMCWKKGVYLKFKTAYASVIMKDSIAEKKIEIKVNADDNSANARELLYIIRRVINEINHRFTKISVEELVPCNCRQGCPYTFAYNTLCKALDRKVEKIQCHDSFQNVDVLKLLEGIDVMKTQDDGPYLNQNNFNISPVISPVINPVFHNTNSADNDLVQNNVFKMNEVKNIIMEMQGDIAEISEDILEEVPEERRAEVEGQLEKINVDLESIGDMNTPEEVIKSGKLNKLKRWLSEFADEDSEIRKALTGTKNILTVIGGLVNRFNGLAEKLGINLLPPFLK